MLGNSREAHQQETKTILEARGTKLRQNSTSNGEFNFEQMEQIYQIFSSLQTSCQLSSKSQSSSLAHKGNFLKALHSSQFKTP